MSDEQMIYIGPEEDLTQVRQRLENASSRRVTLVLPPQTQLRSHVAWKLLHARARELGKDVLIVSSDPQIRSVAQAVKFKVATSYESSQSERGRTPTRSGRSSANRGKPTRLPYNRNSSEPRSAGGQRSARMARSPYGSQGRQSNQPSQWYPSTNESITTQQRAEKIEHEEETFTSVPRIHDEPISSPPFDLSAERSSESYEYRVHTTPPIRSLSPEQIEEEPDMLLEDFNQAQDIWHAAQESESSRAGAGESEPRTASPSNAVTPDEEKPSYRPMSGSGSIDDPFSHLDEPQTPLKGEQRGAVSLEGLDTSEHPVQDISERPTEILDVEIEDLGDQGTFEIEAHGRPITRSRFEEEPEERRVLAESARAYEERRRSEKTGGVTGLPARPAIESDDELPPVEERPTQITRQSSPASQKLPPARVPQPNMQPAPQIPSPVSSRNVQLPPVARGRTPALPRPASQGKPPIVMPRPRSGAVRTWSRRPGRTSRMPLRRSIGSYVFGLIAIFGFLLIGALAYLVPSADVTVALPSHDYAHAVKLSVLASASATNAPGTVAADVLTKEFTKSGSGTATGTKSVDTAHATGNVIFTNNGSHAATIPAGILVATADGKQFATTADAVVEPKGDPIGNTIPIPVDAQAPGTSGNVAAGAITVILSDSLKQVAQASHLTTADLQLQVTNVDPTQGGGVGSASVITRNDLDTTATALQASLKDDINRWERQQKTATQDLTGPPSIQAQLVNTPGEGQVIASGNTFAAQLKATVTIMVVHAADLRAATTSTLNDLLKKDPTYTGYVVNKDAPQSLNVQSPTFSTAGKTLFLNFTALAKAIPVIQADDVRNLIVGQSVTEANIKLRGLQNVQSVEIKTSPGFISWISFMPAHINVQFVPGAVQSQQPKPKK